MLLLIAELLSAMYPNLEFGVEDNQVFYFINDERHSVFTEEQTQRIISGEFLLKELENVKL